MSSTFNPVEKYYPVTVVDNFYDNPDEIREFALSLPFNIKDSSYPGARTDSLHLIDRKFFDFTTNRLMSLFFDFLSPVEWEISTSFQMVKPYGVEGDVTNFGWIHRDDESIITGIVYLNPTPNENSGTRIYELAPGVSMKDLDNQQAERRALYGDNYTPSNYGDAMLKHRACFKETLNIPNKYNRLACFDGSEFHGVDNLYTEDFRLTQVFFTKKLVGKANPPLTRLKGYKYER